MVNGRAAIKAEDRRYHWLGSGVYFWENDPDRALEWAQEKASRRELRNPAVIGAVIELGQCLDLSVRENVPLVKAAHDSLEALYAKSGDKMPENKKAPKDDRDDKVMRYLDCAVLNHLIENSPIAFDTVRGLFVEGGRVYEGAEIFNKTHVELAVRSLSCIRGLFLPL
ncbi:MAG: hypothetical protein WDM84_08825 [Bauldia sp.]